MEHFDAILYINLEHRKDRNEHFLREIPKLCTDQTKIIRVDAISKPYGGLGCALSHIKAMELFLENTDWNAIIIMEDDFTFRNSDIEFNNNQLRTIIRENSEWDVISLAGSYPKLIDTNNASYKKVIEHATASGYAIHRPFLKTLYDNLVSGATILQNNIEGKNLSQILKDKAMYVSLIHPYCCDQYWKSLQASSKWFIHYPALGYQMESFSDIEKKVVNYKC